MEIVKRILEPTAGVAPEIGFYLSGWETIRAKLRDAVSDLSDDELARRAFPGAHQIGALVLHIGEAEAHWIQSVIAGRELDDEVKKFVHWDDTTETDFAEKGYDAKECVRRIDEVSRISREFLAKFTGEDLERVFAFEGENRRYEVSLRWALNHLIDHESTHKGQIAMLKRILRENDE